MCWSCQEGVALSGAVKKHCEGGDDDDDDDGRHLWIYGRYGLI